MSSKKIITLVAGLAILVTATYFGFGGADRNNIAQAQDKTADVKLDSEKAKLGYMYGIQIANDMISAGAMDELDVEAFMAAQSEVFAGKEPRMTPEEMQAVQQAYMNKQQAAAVALAAENKARGDAYLAENKVKEGVKTTDSGLQYEVLRAGKGKQPSKEGSAKVHYQGTLTDGTTFDSSYARNEPATFPVGGLIPGFTEGLLLMKEGAKYRFVIPSDIAYGERASGPIGPNEVLVFEVELLEVL
ncbi:MAG: FKBP-type peptidyl-prolyl cis-trans isomerase [Gammaproteobacteria bacterium]|nr:FKBP-type peptidyl-prolyl cis-trans isomerase [Gammaproteobacteria bacterium]